MKIEAKYLTQAYMIIRDQHFVPESPGRYSNTGEAELCFASAIVVAKANIESNLRDSSLAATLIDSGSKQNVIDIGGQLGIDRSILNQALIDNDSFSDSERKFQVLREIARMIHADGVDPNVWPAAN